MNKLFLINEKYYVMAFDYYDAITKFQKYQNKYDESIIEKIELVSEDIVDNAVIKLKETNKEDGVCERCGTTKNVSYVVDPYVEEIHDITRWCWLCDSCYQEYCDDI